MENEKNEQGMSTSTIILLILGLVILVILILEFTLGWDKIGLGFMGKKQPTNTTEEKDYSNYYYFPENYTNMDCPEFVNATNDTICFIGVGNSSILVKNGDYFIRYVPTDYLGETL